MYAIFILRILLGCKPIWLQQLTFLPAIHEYPFNRASLWKVVIVVKNLPVSARDIRDTGSILGHSNPLQYSCLENPMERGAWEATVHRVTKSQTQVKWLSTAQHPTKSRCKFLGIPWRSVVKASCSYCCRPRFDPRSGN